MYKEAQQLLNSESEDDRCAGIEMIVAVGRSNGIELLATQLEREQSTFVRRRLIATLGAWYLPYTALVVGRLLASSDAYVRNAALAIMQTLGEISLPVLTELINHPNCDLRKLAADALNKIAGDAACSLLLGGLKDSDPNVVSTCAEALGNRRDFRIIPALIASLAGTQNVWVAFSMMESLAKIGDHTILDVIEQYVNKKTWNREERITLAGIWVVATSQLGDERQLPAAWEMYHNKILTMGQMLTLLDQLQVRGVTLDLEQVAIESMLEVFFADTLKNSAVHEVTAAIHITRRNCPALLYQNLSVMIDRFYTTETVMEELGIAVKLTYLVVEASQRDPSIYKLLSYMYEHDPYLEHRSFILDCPEIFHSDHYTATWNWLVDSLDQSDRLLKIAAVRGMCRMGEAGRHYLKELLELALDEDRQMTELIRQEIDLEWRPDR
ncbi:HEAT repeat domain-containing protein [Pelosinus sp. sgz500959]|uniref:HEAT repeat domain-containing protein n=1 Tax=Pelosinus sp. sgz500959 TaxID=3242472 RepID=UPI00366EF8ED